MFLIKIKRKNCAEYTEKKRKSIIPNDGKEKKHSI